MSYGSAAPQDNGASLPLGVLDRSFPSRPPFARFCLALPKEDGHDPCTRRDRGVPPRASALGTKIRGPLATPRASQRAFGFSGQQIIGAPRRLQGADHRALIATSEIRGLQPAGTRGRTPIPATPPGPHVAYSVSRGTSRRTLAGDGIGTLTRASVTLYVCPARATDEWTPRR